MTLRTSAPARAGMITAAIWLIGVGLVFLVQQQLGVPWGRAWPLWIVLVGAASLITAVLGLRGSRFNAWTIGWAFVWPLVFLAAGLLLLADNLGWADVDAWAIIAGNWPWVLIALGAVFLVGALLDRSGAAAGDLSVDLRGAERGEVRIAFGAGDLRVGAGTSGRLVTGTLAGAGRVVEGEPGVVKLEPESGGGWPFTGQRLDWRIGIAPDVPVELHVESGANRTELDLRDTRVERLRIATGASSTSVWLPRAAGMTHVRAESGAASISFSVPEGVAARIRSKVVLGSTSIDEARFPRTPDGWASPDFETATNRVEIDAQGGVGSLTVR